MTIQYKPHGVCSQLMTIEADNNIIKSVQVLGGCSGNLKGLSILLIGMNVQDAISRMEGISCGPRSTSCPDQLAQALKQFPNV